MTVRMLALALVLGLALLPAAEAHKPSSSTHAKAYSWNDLLDPITVDGSLGEDAWDDLTDDESVDFDSPDSGDSTAFFVWQPETEKLYVGLQLRDDTDDGIDDYVDFAIAFDHADETADDGDQRIVRVHRDGTEERVNVEDDTDVDAGAPPEFTVTTTTPAGNYWYVEMEIDWDNENHGGWAVWQEDNSDEEEYPAGAHREKPNTWTDVKGLKREVPITLTVDKTSVKAGDSVSLTASVDEDEVDVDMVDKMIFEYSFDGTTWTNLGSKSIDTSGRAKIDFTIAQARDHKIRATTAEEDYFAAGTSNVVDVDVADTAKHVAGDATYWIKYANDGGDRRTYTLLANASDGDIATWEVSADGARFIRLSTGTTGAALSTVFAAPDNNRWHARPVWWSESGNAEAGPATELTPHSIPTAGKTATSTALTADVVGWNLTLKATVTGATSGSVTFYRAPATTLGSASVGTDGKAELKVEKPLPGPHTYVAWYSGPASHAPSAGRAEEVWWPEAGVFDARETDEGTERIEVDVEAAPVGADAEWRFRARPSTGPGIPGYLHVALAAPDGERTLFDGYTDDGEEEGDFEVEDAGEHTVVARFYRAGTAVTADARDASFTAVLTPVSLAIDLPAEVVAGATANVTIRFLSAGEALTLSAGTVRLEEADGSAWNLLAEAAANGSSATLAWTPAEAGNRTIRATYSGAPGYEDAESESVTLGILAAEVPDDGDGEPGPGETGTPAPAAALAALVAALAALAVRRRR